MGDRGVIRRIGGGARRVQVNPLAVFGGFGELRDALLVNRKPATQPDLLADQGFQFGDSIDDA